MITIGIGTSIGRRLRMGKLLATLVIAILLVPSSASASDLFRRGECVLTSDGRVSLLGTVTALDYYTYAPVIWVYRHRPVGVRSWIRRGLDFRESLEVRSDRGFTAVFKSDPRVADGMIYRLDVELLGYGRVPVAYYKDTVTPPEQCRLRT
jgi:hypothetical protein